MSNAVVTKTPEGVTAAQSALITRKGVDAIRKFEAAKKAETAAKAVKAEMEAIIRAELDGAEIGTHQGLTVVEVKHSTNSRIDSKMLAEVFPEAYEATHIVTPYTFLKGSA